MLAVDLIVELDYAKTVLELEQNSDQNDIQAVNFWQSKIDRLNKQLKELM